MLFAVLLFAGTLAHAADKSEELRARLKAAADLAALNASDIKPWHCQADITVYHKAGNNPQAGNIEMWFSGTNMLTRYSIGSDRLAVLRVADNIYTAGDLRKFGPALFIQMQLLHPIPDEVFQQTVTERLTREKSGNLVVDWIAPTVVQQRSNLIDTGRPFSFAFESGAPRLMITYTPGDLRIVRAQLGLFQNHEVATTLRMYRETTVLSESKIVKLETFQPTDSMFDVLPEMQPLIEPIELEPTTLPGLMLGDRAPVYPQAEKDRRATARLVFNAVIGKDGHVVSLEPAGNFERDFVDSSREAIRYWLYRPFLINGVPVEVKTQINVNFSMG